MAHNTLRESHSRLIERLNRFPQGAPPSELLRRILELLFSDSEADLVSRLPIRPFTAETAASRWGMPVSEAQTVLDELAGRAILLDVVEDEVTTYVLPPPMAGFFEFSLMRVREDLDQKVLSELFYQYINVEDDFIRALFLDGETQLGRVFVSETSLPDSLDLHVLDRDRASQVVESASHIGVGLCYCRHKMGHVGRACDQPLDICMTFNNTAAALTRHGHARPIDAVECLDLLEEARGLGLVQFGENVQERVNFICNCCGCCCEALIAARRFGHLHPVHTTAFMPKLDAEACTGCGKCVAACPVEALSLVSANDPKHPKTRAARLDESCCLGCGVCVPACPEGGISLTEREMRVITPLDSVHRTVEMAIERGRLPDLIFDNRALLSHRTMAAVLGVILRLPPLKQALASRQLRSRYVESLIRRARARV